MKANVGSVDRLLRIVLGLVVLSALVWVQGPARWFGLLGLVPLLTASTRFCPLYTVLGISTCPVSTRP